MATFSGFLSSFTQSSGTNDIMSSVTTTTDNPYYAGGTFIDYYSAGYMYIGNLLIQFTTGTTSTTVPTTASNGSGISIHFPKSFGGTGPYCVLANPLSISNSVSNYTVTVTSSTVTSFTVITGGHDSYVVYIAIGPKLIS
jgi:hypothetical protein